MGSETARRMRHESGATQGQDGPLRPSCSLQARRLGPAGFFFATEKGLVASLRQPLFIDQRDWVRTI
jgi:hypothetical protein